MKVETKLQAGDYAKLIDYDDMSITEKPILTMVLGQEVLLVEEVFVNKDGERYFDVDLEFMGGRITLFEISERYLEYTDGTEL